MAIETQRTQAKAAAPISAAHASGTYRSILVGVQAEGGDKTLKCARNLADRFGAALIGVGSETYPSFLLDSGFAGPPTAILEVLQKVIADDLAIARTAFDAATAQMTGEHYWLEQQTTPATALTELADGADLVIVPQAKSTFLNEESFIDAADLVLKCGRPVLVAPRDRDYLSAANVLVAWRNTREARRALADAKPFLKRAGSVYLQQVCRPAEEKSAEESLSRVRAALRRDGIDATVQITKSKGDPVEAILKHADWVGADLIVAGAYGHSRLREWIVGGVTQGLLQQSERFVLLSN